MSLNGLLTFVKGFFGGAWTAPDPTAVDGRGALLAQNMRFFGKQTQTRYGFGVAFSSTANGASFTTSAFDWLSELGNYFVWLGGSNPTRGTYYVSVTANPPVVTLLGSALTGNIPGGSTYAPLGPRIYISYWYNISSGQQVSVIGSNAAVVVSNVSGTFVSDPVLPGPASTSLIPTTAPTEPGAGIVTAGLHNLGIRMLHRSGFLGRPGPDSAGSGIPNPNTFAPIVFTSSGAKNIQWAFTPTGNWPIDVIQVQVVMSPVDSPDQYFLVPGAVQNVAGGSATPISITINIDDGSLVSGAAAIEATASLDFYTGPPTGYGSTPFYPSVVQNIGTRMVYITNLTDAQGNAYSVAFASDPGAYQQISLDQHILQLPNQIKITTVFSVQGSVYLIGPHWTYYTQDNGQAPVTWLAPQSVDSRIGALYPSCIKVNANGTYAWVADTSGLYFFNGSYQTLPISYLQSDIWQQLEFGASEFSIEDDTVNHRVIVFAIVANLGQARMLIWDYTNGLDPYSARFSINTEPNVAGSGSLAIVQNDLYGTQFLGLARNEIWLSPSGQHGGTSYFLREKNPASDSNVYQDDSTGLGAQPVHSIYETPVMPESGMSWPGAGAASGSANILAHQAMIPRITGNGTLTPILYGVDKTVSKTFPTMTLSTSPGARQIQRCYLKSGGFIYHFEQNVVGGYFILSDFTMYYSKYGSHR